LRINYMTLFIEMWCCEVGGLPTTWMTDGTLRNYFSAAVGLFQPEMKTAWDQQIAWLKNPNGENYCAEIRNGIDRLRTGKIEPSTAFSFGGATAVLVVRQPRKRRRWYQERPPRIATL